MEFKDYIQPLIKWWRLIVIATVLAAVSSFWVTLGQPLNYQSRTTLLVGSALTNPNPDSGQIYLASQLATIYAQFARGETIRQATMEALEITWLPQFNVRVIPNSQLIEITVIDIFPERAQIIASELAKQLILLSPASSTSGNGVNRQEFIEEQLDTLQNQIIDTRDEILRLQQELGNLNSARDIENTKNQITALESKLTTLQLNYSSLLANTTEGAVNTIQIIEPATLTTTPIGPNKMLIVIITSFTGAVIAGAAAYLLDFLSKTVESIEDIKREFPYALLGEIPALSKKDSEKSWTYIDENPISGYAEAFRKLRNAIEISTQDNPPRVILVSSGNEADGKSTIASNLAIAFSYLGKKVILVDADFRHHRIHEVFKLQKAPGLFEWLADDQLQLEDVLQYWKGNIFVVASGHFLPNSSELISVPRFAKILAEMNKAADLVILDGPPFFLSETSSIATRVDGILIVIAMGNSKDLIRKMKAQLEMIKTPVIGAVANRIGQGDYYGYYYSSYSDVPTKPVNRPAALFPSAMVNLTGSLRGMISRLFAGGDNSKKRKPKIALDEEQSSRPTVTATVNELRPNGATDAATKDVKTIPRIRNPKSIFDEVILKSSRKGVDEDKEYLHEIARRKREQTSADSGERQTTGYESRIEEGMAFLDSLEVNYSANTEGKSTVDSSDEIQDPKAEIVVDQAPQQEAARQEEKSIPETRKSRKRRTS
jgi:capsular exopolysaccharide synthesis family protein